MKFCRKLAGDIPRGDGLADEQAGELFAVHDETETKFVHADQRRGAVHDAAYGRPFVADDHRVGAHRAEPVEKIQHVRPGDAGE